MDRRHLSRSGWASAGRLRARLATGLSVAAAITLGGCALQPAYVSPEIAVPPAWSSEGAASDTEALGPGEGWWHRLGDSAIDALIEAGFADSPTLAQAVARIDEARAALGVDSAKRVPMLTANASLTRARSQDMTGRTAGTTSLSTSASLGPSLSWEIDLFGRVRNTVEAGRSRLDARTADAASARLTLAADIADDVLSLRACENSRLVLINDIASREKTLVLTRAKLKTGFVAPVDEARILTGIATSRTNLASQEEQCARLVNALVALAGRDATTVRALVGSPGQAPTGIPLAMPHALAALPELPATVLARHPSVISADREAAAAWAEIGVARADRMPRLDLAAVLTGQWIRAAGSTLDFITWSVGPSISGTLFDGGAGKANVMAAEARYRRAVASLRGTLRSTVQDVEDALAAQASADARIVSAGESVAAARTTLTASEAQWKAGSVSLFELEDSRRQFASAQDAEVSARRDQAQAWIALVKATGGAITISPERTDHD